MFVELFLMSNQNTLLRLGSVIVYTRNARRAIPDIILARKEITLNSEPI